MAGREVTRAGLQRALVANALTKPVNVVVTTGVVVAAIVLGVPWLLAVAAGVYAALAALTFFDEEEARRVGERAYGRIGPGQRRVDPGRLAAPIASRLGAALEAESRVQAAIEASELGFAQLGPEVGALVDAVSGTARRAQLVHDYLAAQRPRQVRERLRELRRGSGAGDPTVRETAAALEAQLDAHARMSRQLERFYAEMERTAAILDTIHADIVRMGVAAGSSDERELAGRLRDLREQVDVVSEGIGEAYERADVG